MYPVNTFDAIRARRSFRNFQSRPVSRSLLKKVVRAGTLAPSAHDLQPWRVVALDDPSVKERLAVASSSAFLKSLQARHVPNAKAKADKARARIVRTPALLVVCLDRSVLRPESSSKRRRNEWIMGAQSVAAMIENMLLEATGLGLGACWRGAALFIRRPLREILDLPETFEPQALVEIGYPKVNSKKKARRHVPLEDVLRFNRWGATG